MRSRRLERVLFWLLLAACDARREHPAEPAQASRGEPAPRAPAPETPPASPGASALAASREWLLIDGHVDLPHRLRMAAEAGLPREDVSQRTASGHFDAVRAREGGLDAAFMSIYVPPSYQKRGGARALADRLIDGVEELVRRHPLEFALAATPAEIHANAAAGKISLPLGIENGAALERDLANVAHFRRRGVSYVTLAHSRDNAIADSSYADENTHGGLSPFGRSVVDEMNRTGILIDVSHISDAAFFDVLERSRVPVIASHSALRHFVPGFRRNMSDEMVRALAKNGGVVLIPFGSEFLSPLAHQAVLRRWAEGARFAARKGLVRERARDRLAIEAHAAASVPLPRARVEDVAAQIDRVKALAGIDHVGLGSDFEGVGDTLPPGLEDVSGYPKLLEVLLARGYSEAELKKLCAGNVLRVWQAALSYAEGQRLPLE